MSAALTRLRPGVEFSVAGERGARFRCLGVLADGREVDAWGGRPGREMFRTFSTTRIRVVHRDHKLRNVAA